MATEPRPLEIQQIQAFLRNEFSGYIEGTGKSEQARERNFLSKALAAYFLVVEAEASKSDAVNATIDGGDDHGIDSVYVGPTGIIWLVQSKYRHDGKGEPTLGDATKFKDGVVDLVAGRYGRFNDALQLKRASIDRAKAGDYQVRFAFVYTGTSLNDDRLQMFGDVEESINALQPRRARFVRYGLYDVHAAVIARRSEEVIIEEIELRNYGLIDRPARAVYGVMQVRDLAELYQRRDNALVRANIRRYRGSSRVNDAMLQTLADDHENFVFFNNGVTLLCDRLTLVGDSDPNRARGRFRLAGLSIINGAQTAGTVAKQPLAHYDARPAGVLVTCIESRVDVEGFGDRVTEYRNNQNAVQLQDFISLDDNQENWRKTLKASGVSYIYKPSVNDPLPRGNVFTVSEAATYLALAYADRDEWMHAHLAVKTSPQRLWDRQADFCGVVVTDGSRSAYKRLFPDSLTARRLWRTTQIGRVVRATIDADLVALDLEARAREDACADMVIHLILGRGAIPLDAVTLALTGQELEALSRAIDTTRRAVLEAFLSQSDWDGREPAEILVDPGNLQLLKRIASASFGSQSGQ